MQIEWKVITNSMRNIYTIANPVKQMVKAGPVRSDRSDIPRGVVRSVILFGTAGML